MSMNSYDPVQIQSEIIHKKRGVADQVLQLLLEGKELAQDKINYHIPEIRPHHLASIICELRNGRLVPVKGEWTNDRIKRYWMTAEAISDYLDTNARHDQIRTESANLKRRRLERDAACAIRFANAVNDSDYIEDEHPFVLQVTSDLIELLCKANKKTSPSPVLAQAQDYTNDIKTDAEGGIDNE